ncbi:hypothetical protein LEP1GSC088_3551 [Leptospira interrogans str. L1207]|nr:hypothetical protein LEP1GSC088_3551 [Leptospira interrogans str. L1207]
MQTFFSGVLLSIACWYRQEVFVLTSCLIVSTPIKVFSEKEELIKESKQILIFFKWIFIDL